MPLLIIEHVGHDGMPEGAVVTGAVWAGRRRRQDYGLTEAMPVVTRVEHPQEVRFVDALPRKPWARSTAIGGASRSPADADAPRCKTACAQRHERQGPLRS